MAAAAMAKALRGGRSGLSSGLLPAICRRVPQERMLPGSSPTTPTAGMGRLMHTGQWQNRVFSHGGGSIKAPLKMEQFSSKRFLRWDPHERVSPPDHPVSALIAACFVSSLVSLAFTAPSIYRSANGLYRLYKK